MNLARLAHLVAITTAVAAIADGQLEFDGENLPTKLNHQEYISQFISKTESTAPINIEPLILGGSIVPSGTKTYTTGVRPAANVRVGWGNRCGRTGYPGVYGRVSIARDWLSSVAPGTMFH
ncbi:unnamed protein product [Peronospora destructor]|uniref:Uncharacterized protein n=1 Tax=Peronospora destructor TaxID=86335 RepID=A0AAV0TYD4_9STRA|nr:unnamed protein product [Peronospora destructor]